MRRLFCLIAVIACASLVMNVGSAVSLKLAKITRTVLAVFAGISERFPPFGCAGLDARMVIRAGRSELSFELTLPFTEILIPGVSVVGIAAISMRRTVPSAV